MEVIVTRGYVSWSNFWCCCSLSKVVVPHALQPSIAHSTFISTNSIFNIVYQTQGLWYCIEICRLSEILTINADNSEGAIF